MICPQCQQSVRDGARFCDSCGLSIGSIASANQAAEGLAETLKAADPLIGHVIDSKYKLIEQLGKGGMGVVYRAERVLVGDHVALKILRAEFVAEEETVERFRREARAAAKLRHPNIVTIYDYGEARGADAPAYIVMELLEGESLRDLLKREGRLRPERAVQLMRGICAGIGMAHRREIVHRDIKPDNIILLPADEEEGREQEMVKVVDFGIAKLRDAATGGTLTRRGFQPGTIFYMSPEQCRGDTLDARSDVYSLGALLYEMLSGTPPFMAETQTGVMSKHLFEAPPPFPKKLNIPVPIQSAVMRALAKDAEARQSDASTLGRELLESSQQEREELRRKEEEQRRIAAVERERLDAEELQKRETEARAAELRLEEEQARLRRESQERRRIVEESAQLRPGERKSPGRESEAMRGLWSDAEAARRHEEEARQLSTAPQQTPDTDASLSQPALTERSPQIATGPDKLDPVSLASLGLADVEPAPRGGAGKLWFALGLVVIVGLAVFLSLKFFRSESSTDTAQNPDTSTASSSAASATAVNYKPIGNPLPTERDVFKVAVSPSGKTLISTGSASMTPTAPITDHFDISGTSLAFSPDGKLLAVGQEDGSIIVKDSTDLSHKREMYEHKDYVFFVGFSDDGRKLVSASGDKALVVWNVSTGKQEERIGMGANELIVTIDPTRLRAAVFYPPGGPLGRLQIQSITDASAVIRFDNDRADVTCGAFSTNGETLALGTSSGKVQVWRASDGNLIREHQGPTGGEVGSVAFAPDGQYLAIGWNNGDIELLRMSDGSSVQTLKGHTRVVRTLSFSRDGRVLASGAEDKTIRLWQNEEIKK